MKVFSSIDFEKMLRNEFKKLYHKKQTKFLTSNENEILKEYSERQKILIQRQSTQTNNILNYFGNSKNGGIPSNLAIRVESENSKISSESTIESPRNSFFKMNLKSGKYIDTKSDSHNYRNLLDLTWLIVFTLSSFDFEKIEHDLSQNQLIGPEPLKVFQTAHNNLKSQMNFILQNLCLRLAEFSTFKFDLIFLSLLNSSHSIISGIINLDLIIMIFPALQNKLCDQMILNIIHDEAISLGLSDFKKSKATHSQFGILTRILKRIETLASQCQTDLTCEILILISNLCYSTFTPTCLKPTISYLSSFIQNFTESDTQNFFNLISTEKTEIQKFQALNLILESLFSILENSQTQIDFENSLLRIKMKKHSNLNSNGRNSLRIQNSVGSKRKSNGIIVTETKPNQEGFESALQMKSDKLLDEMIIFSEKMLKLPIFIQSSFDSSVLDTSNLNLDQYDYESFLGHLANYIPTVTVQKFRELLFKCNSILKEKQI